MAKKKWDAGNYMGSGMSKGAYQASLKNKTKSVASKYVAPKSSSSSGGMLPIAEKVDAKTASIRQAAIDRMPEQDYAGKANEYAYGGSAMNKATKTASKSKSSSKKTSSKSNDALGGKSFAEASKAVMNKQNISQGASAPVSTKSPWRKYLDQGLDYIKQSNPTAGLLAKGLENFNVDMTSVLGIPRAEASGTDFMEFPLQPGAVLNQPYTPDKVTSSEGGIDYYNDFQPPKPTRTTPVNSTPVNPTPVNSTPEEFGPSNENRRSSRVSSPFNFPYKANILTQGAVDRGYLPQSTPDYSGNSNQSRGTVRRSVGMGEMSRGQYSNGAGGYGFQGSIGGTNKTTTEQELLNSLFGIDTAQASGADTTSYPGLTFEGQGLKGLTFGRGMSDIPAATVTPQATGGTTGGSMRQGMGNAGIGATSPRVQGGGQANESFGYDQQMKEQEKAYKQQQKAQERALKELLKSINAQYDQSTQEGTQALEKQKQEDLLKLSGLFGFANQDPNSEQRLQYQQRAQNDAQTQLTNLLAKLGQGRAQDISGAQQNYQSQVAQLAQQRAQQMQQIQQAQQQQAMRMAQATRGAQPRATGTGRVSHQDIFNWVNDALAQGGTWEEIAQQAEASGVDTSTGSYLDQLLNQANKQGRWA